MSIQDQRQAVLEIKAVFWSLNPKNPLPAELIDLIIDYAEIWVHSTVDTTGWVAQVPGVAAAPGGLRGSEENVFVVSLAILHHILLLESFQHKSQNWCGVFDIPVIMDFCEMMPRDGNK